jgi:hypothetical protein
MHSVTSNAVSGALSVKLPVLLFSFANHTDNKRYFKANGIFPQNKGSVAEYNAATAITIET